MNQNFSQKYLDNLEKSIAFHEKSINWSGDGSYQYVNRLQEIVKSYQCRTMLDYGCGKGDQYTGNEITDFSKIIGVEEYSLYDPAYEKYKILSDKQWDLVICLDVLPFIPEEDILTIKNILLSKAIKKVVIGLQIANTKDPYKSKKPFVCFKSLEWWNTTLKDDKITIIWLDPEKPFDREEFLKSRILHTSNS